MSSSRCLEPALSAARLFVQLSSRRPSSANSVLDVLAPATARVRHFTAAAITSRLSSSIRSTTQAPCPTRSIIPNSSHDLTNHVYQFPSSTRRAFSAAARRQATQAVHNPQADDDGNNMILEITPRAAKRLEQIMMKDGNPDLALRIQVESGGCHGFQYVMSLTTIPAEFAAQSGDLRASSQALNSEETVNEVAPSTTTSDSPTAPALGEEDTVFAYVPEPVEGGRTEPTAQGTHMAKVILDKPSLDLLKGSKVDYTMELIGSQFKIVDNPYATSSCGCGTSFDIKM